MDKKSIRNISIGTQLVITFFSMILFIIVLGIFSGVQTNELYQQTEEMYNHPLQIRRAISTLEINVLNIEVGMHNFISTQDNDKKLSSLQLIEITKENVQQQFDILYEYYLGPKVDVDLAYENYMSWVVMQDKSIQLIENGETVLANNQLLDSDISNKYREQMMIQIKTIDDFARTKADELYLNSLEVNKKMTTQLIFMIFVIVVLTFIISYNLLINIRIPLKKLIDTAIQFKGGDMEARVSYDYKNEFGALTEAFNSLIKNIQANVILEEKKAELAGIMLSENDAKKFFHETLKLLAEHTGAQFAAVYLLSDNEEVYEHFDSLGLNEQGRTTFLAREFEGEFGIVLAKQTYQYLKDIPSDTRFVYKTISGECIPHEIITIPIVYTGKVRAIISIGSIKEFYPNAISFIEGTLDTINARTEGILAYKKIKEVRHSLENQNRELDIQHSELAAQTKVLTQQNIELEVQKNKLNEANMLKTNFLSNMSHELRTPLNSVIALAGVLNRRLAGEIPKKEHSYLEVIERNGKNLLLLINDILDISRIESGREEFDIIKFDLNNLISDVVNMIEPQVKERPIQLIHSRQNLEIMLTSDESKVSHILQNLLSNAIKFTEEGTITIDAKTINNQIELKVSDTGIGIREEQIVHIFDEFRQADGSTSRKYGGTGLGLAIAKKYVNILGGEISVDSTFGKGSNFVITIPIKFPGESKLSVKNTRKMLIKNNKKEELIQSVEPTNTKTILVVEDSEPAIMQIQELVKENEYNILVAKNGKEALDIMSESLPDAIILDLMMPDFDGFDVIRELHGDSQMKAIPILVLTAKQITKEDADFLVDHHIYQLIQKGDVNKVELQNAVTTMLFPELEVKSDEIEQVSKLNIKSRKVIAGKPVVLIVEDNEDNMITVKALLENEYDVIEATDGIKGIEMAKEHVPDLVLMDIALPGINGIEAFKMIRRDSNILHIPVIALTASAMVQDREAILVHGFEAFISKPIIEKEFFDTIKGVLYGK